MTILKNLGLGNIPQRKLLNSLENTLQECQECRDGRAKLNSACNRCRIINKALQRYAEANIPVKYWQLDMVKFLGDKSLVTKYEEVTKDLKQSYQQGVALCFAGSHGVGKTLTLTSILKRAVESGYSGLYVTLNDVIVNLINHSENRAALRNEFLTVDFLVIDEFDPRYIGSDTASDLFGRVLEDIIRTRSQNSLPIFICTNSPNLLEAFHGSLKTSLTSLMNYFVKVPVIGLDQRKKGL